MVDVDTFVPHRTSVISLTRHIDMPAGYIFDQRSFHVALPAAVAFSMIVVSKETPLSLGTFSGISSEVVVRFRL